MTNKEAIKWFEVTIQVCHSQGEALEAMKTAINALELQDEIEKRVNEDKVRAASFSFDKTTEILKQPMSATPQPCGDCISREALLAKIDEERKYLLALKMDGAEHIVVHHARRIIEDIPPVTPQPKIGRWEVTYNNGDIYHLRCSACKEEDCRMYPTDKYCPNCGAKMEVET